VTVVNPSTGHVYEIYCDNTLVAILTGADQAGVPALTVGQTYKFSNRVLVNRVPSVMSTPVSYTVSSQLTQQVNLPPP
jgi:translation initiation factor 2B subunit (eIF-2B alpha/beta/delta family)